MTMIGRWTGLGCILQIDSTPTHMVMGLADLWHAWKKPMHQEAMSLGMHVGLVLTL